MRDPSGHAEQLPERVGVGGHLRKEAGRAKLAAIVGKARILLLSRTLPAPRDLPSQFIGQRVERPRSH